MLHLGPVTRSSGVSKIKTFEGIEDLEVKVRSIDNQPPRSTTRVVRELVYIRKVAPYLVLCNPPMEQVLKYEFVSRSEISSRSHSLTALQ